MKALNRGCKVLRFIVSTYNLMAYRVAYSGTGVLFIRRAGLPTDYPAADFQYLFADL
jgi:hypothetical protein